MTKAARNDTDATPSPRSARIRLMIEGDQADAGDQPDERSDDLR